MFNLKPCILMKQYVKLYIALMILTVIKAHPVMTFYISRKIWNNFETLFYYISMLKINILFVACYFILWCFSVSPSNFIFNTLPKFLI